MKSEFYVICDNIRSLENIGSIFRTADALGVSKIFLCGISGSSPTNFGLSREKKRINPKLYSKLVGDKPPVGESQAAFFEGKGAQVAKTALGAEKTVPFEYIEQTWRLVEKLKKNKINIIALEQDKRAVDYRNFKPEFPLALILGNEVDGISENILKKADHIIYLPMLGKKESLNVSVSFGIAGYEINKNRL